jgi:hypothetical protein
MSSIVALVVLVISLLVALGLTPAGASLLWWLLAALAFAVVIGEAWPIPWPWRKS